MYRLDLKNSYEGLTIPVLSVTPSLSSSIFNLLVICLDKNIYIYKSKLNI